MPVKKKLKSKKTTGQAKSKNVENVVEETKNIVPQHNAYYNYAKMKQKKYIMWFGVFFMAALVLFMWSLNTWSVFKDIDESKELSYEAKILNTQAENLKKIIDDADIKENLQKLQVQNIENKPIMTDEEKLNLLIKNINEITASSTMSTSTYSASSTTPAFTTSSDNIILETQN